MIDPLTAFAAASAAYTGFRKIIGHAQDLEQVSKQLGSWYGACADINKAEAQRKSPTFLERATQGKSIEEEALEILIHKKNLKIREVEIKKRQIQNNMAVLGLSILIIAILGGGMYLITLVI